MLIRERLHGLVLLRDGDYASPQLGTAFDGIPNHSLRALHDKSIHLDSLVSGRGKGDIHRFREAEKVDVTFSASTHGYALPTVARRGSRSFGCAALRMFRANQEAKSVSIMRTRSAQIGVQSATINAQLDGRIGSQKEGLEGDEGGRQDKRNQGALFVSPCPAIA